MNRLVLTVALFLVAAAPPCLAASRPRPEARTIITDPAAFVVRGYRGLNPPEGEATWAPGEEVYSPHLAALFALDRRETPRGDEGRLDFDFWIDGNDGDSPDLVVTSRDNSEAPGRRIVTARFHSFHEAKEIHFYFERVGRHWLLDDVRKVGPGGWTLSLILKYGDDREVEHGAGF